MNKLLRAGMRYGWQRGVVDGNRLWVVVGAAALVGHLGRRAMTRRDEVLWSGPVAPGQVLTVQTVTEP